eukprot:15454240-Alexandrium_andersonii.AAC.1
MPKLRGLMLSWARASNASGKFAFSGRESSGEVSRAPWTPCSPPGGATSPPNPRILVCDGAARERSHP